MAGISKVTATRKPRGKPFKKGQSGNPSGRPKGSDDVRDLARTYTVEAIEKLAKWMRSDNAKASVSACSALLDRGWGKATQALSNPDGSAITIQIVKFGRAARAEAG